MKNESAPEVREARKTVRAGATADLSRGCVSREDRYCKSVPYISPAAEAVNDAWVIALRGGIHSPAET